jgi:hypothetical protein
MNCGNVLLIPPCQPGAQISWFGFRPSGRMISATVHVMAVDIAQRYRHNPPQGTIETWSMPGALP